MPDGTLRQRLFAWALAAGAAPYERAMRGRKRALLGGLAGTVVEVGPGVGANLPHFGPDVRWVGVEPNPAARARLRARADRLGRPVEFTGRDGRGDGAPPTRAPTPSSATLVLCSVPDVGAALGEALRVLRPGGRYVFVEHVAAPPGERAQARAAGRPPRLGSRRRRVPPGPGDRGGRPPRRLRRGPGRAVRGPGAVRRPPAHRRVRGQGPLATPRTAGGSVRRRRPTGRR